MHFCFFCRDLSSLVEALLTTSISHQISDWFTMFIVFHSEKIRKKTIGAVKAESAETIRAVKNESREALHTVVDKAAEVIEAVRNEGTNTIQTLKEEITKLLKHIVRSMDKSHGKGKNSEMK